MLHGDPPRSVPKLVGHLSFGRALGRVTLFSERSERSRSPRHRGAASYGVVLAPDIYNYLLQSLTASNCESLNLFQAGSTIQCGILLAGLLLEADGSSLSEARNAVTSFSTDFLNADHSR